MKYLPVLCLALAFGVSACGERPPSVEEIMADHQSKLEANKTLSLRVNNEILSGGNLNVADEILSPDYVDHNAPPGFSPGVAGFKEQITMYRTAFPDLRIVADDLIAEGGKVVTRWTATGTHNGELMGIAPTGNKVTVQGIAIDRIIDGKIVEHWDVFDQLGMLQQIGAIPAE
jgi:predicted ester cyclase